MAWTSEQQSAIDTTGKNILVSAAAGSGKTAVLVERICQRVLDPNDPVDIDSFLVVTFTKAAAAQMKEKIAARFWAELEKQPDNEHLMKQTILVNKADITTIDSFCLRIVKEYFSLLDIDSDFSIGDTGMIELLKSDVLDEMFEELYSTDDEVLRKDFVRLVNMFGGDRDDSALRDIIKKIHGMAQSYPKPEEWLDNAFDALCYENAKALPWIEAFVSSLHNLLDDARVLNEMAMDICNMPGGPYNNVETVEADLAIIDSLGTAKSYNELYPLLAKPSWPRKKACKKELFDEELVERFDELRKEYKGIIDTYSKMCVSQDTLKEEMELLKSYLHPLLSLVRRFEEAFMAEKKRRHIMEFADIEHFAYQLVCDSYDELPNGYKLAIPTEIGKAIGERYKEIYIDEYQDSNYLQEDILMSVSGMYKKEYNTFMVGDVKQSIYRFRMARPDLFVCKYNSFAKLEPDSSDNEVKIELKNNFRSRDIVLDCVNFFFYQLMGADLGKIEYTRDVALVPTKEYIEPEKSMRIAEDAEILIVDMNKEILPVGQADKGEEEADLPESISDKDEDLEKAELNKFAVEAKMIGNKIKNLLNEEEPFFVFDEEKNIYRKATFKDIVILVRGIKNKGDVLYDTLTAMNIPVFVEEPQGYFEATEIRVLMSYLAVIDNPKQDIPLAATLISPLAGLNENDLAMICTYSEDSKLKTPFLYDKCLCYIEDCEGELKDKLASFFDTLYKLRAIKNEVSISELLLRILDETKYYYYIQAMPMGMRRKANVNMLVEKARKYEDGSYKGLFNFLRYVDKLKVNEVDFGESNTISDDENVVRVMTMHKSKGLEFPIVFVSGLGTQFNNEDSKNNVFIHPDYYVSSNLMFEDKRYKRKSFMRSSICMLNQYENLAEEMRVLYVAMTRAKEKLIMTGAVNDYLKLVGITNSMSGKVTLSYTARSKKKSFIEWIIACMQRHAELLETPYGQDVKLSHKIYAPSEIEEEDIDAIINKKVTIDSIIDNALDSYDEELLKQFKESLIYEYPYEKLTKVKSKMPIADIKKMKAQDIDVDETSDNQFKYDDSQEEKSDLESEEESKSDSKPQLTGAMRGTLVHKYMELVPFHELEENQDYRKFAIRFLDKLKADKVFDEFEATAINPNKINYMLKSSLGQRMIASSKKNNLFKEQQFSIGFPPSEIFTDLKSEDEKADDLIIVQGIVDAFFYEDDEIVLMDYKTDRGTKEEINGKYHGQLTYYASTLEKLTGCKVKEKLIYSFYLNEVFESYEVSEDEKNAAESAK